MHMRTQLYLKIPHDLWITKLITGKERFRFLSQTRGKPGLHGKGKVYEVRARLRDSTDEETVRLGISLWKTQSERLLVRMFGKNINKLSTFFISHFFSPLPLHTLKEEVRRMLMFNRSVPLVWRSSSCLQIGIDDPVLIDGLSTADRELIELIKMGISPEVLADKASHVGLTHERTASLLNLLEESQALVPRVQLHTTPVTYQVDAVAHSRRANPSEFMVALKKQKVVCVGPLAPKLSKLLSACGFNVTSATSLLQAKVRDGSIVVLTSVWVPDLMGARSLHDSGTQHVSVCVQQEQATVTHVVCPSLTPCITCLTHYIIDVDDDWMTGWRGLREQAPSARRVDPLLAWSSLVTCARVLREYVLQDFTIPHTHRVDLAGDVSTSVAQFHTACDCRVAQVLEDLTASSMSSPN